MGRLKYFIALHLCILVFSMTEVLGKFAAIAYKEEGLQSIRLYVCIILMLFVCVFYAFCWQKIIKHFDLHIAYANRSVYLIWSQIWAVFAVFSLSLSALAVFVVPMNITLMIVVLLGVAECISGVMLRNWPIIVSGAILGIGGAVAAVLLKSEAQLLLFTLGGVLLALTGLIVKQQYR